MDQRLKGQSVEAMDRHISPENVRVVRGPEQLGRATLIGPRAPHVFKTVVDSGVEARGRLTLMGPQAAELLKKVMDSGVESLDGSFRHGKRAIGGKAVTVFRNDLAGEAQYELIVPRDQLVSLWQILHEAGNGHEGE